MIEVDKERRFAEIPGVHAQRRRPVLDTPYISRVLPLDKATATAATDAWHSGRASMAGGRRLVAGHGLRLRQTFEPTDFDPLLLRRLFGTLWVNWWPVAVEIDLVQYSRGAAEIALRPSKMGWPVLTERYERMRLGRLKRSSTRSWRTPIAWQSNQNSGSLTREDATSLRRRGRVPERL